MVIALCLLMSAGAAIAAPAANQRVDLRALVLATNGGEPGVQAWQQELRRQGVPFDVFLVEQAAPLTAATLANGTTHAKYQVVIMADDLVALSMDAAEIAALRAFEVTFGIRQIDTFAFPSPEEGLVYSGHVGPMSDLGTEASLTPEGRAEFPYLVGRISYDPTSYGFSAVPGEGVSVRSLVPGPEGSTLLALVTWPDGRQEMVSTVSVGPHMIHGSLLLRGMLAWGTERVNLGQWRNYYSAHIDDVFLGDDRWDTVANVTHEDDGATLPIIRMAPADVLRAASWSVANGIKLDFAFNGAGMDEAIAEHGSDPLSAALLANKGAFRWLNHTYTHLNLDTATQTQIEREIRLNRQFASRNAIPISSGELVTGEHSGLANPAMPAALTNTAIRWFGSDNSRQPDPYRLGSGIAVPRHPSNIYYNVGTFAEQLDEYNYIYHEACVNTPVTTCLTQPATWDQYVASESSIMLRHVLGNDPRPHYMHQANLAEDGTFYPVVDDVLSRYRSYFSPPLVNPTTAAAGTELTRQADWSAALAAGRVTSYRLGAFVYVSLTGSTQLAVPITGTGTPAPYGGLRSRWVTLTPGFLYAFRINTTA